MPDSFFKPDDEQQPKTRIPDLETELPDPGPERAGEGDGFATDESRMAAVLSYIPVLCFVPLLTMKENKEARFHARQGVLLFLLELIAALFLIDGISDFVFKAVLLIAIALSLVGIYFALQGKNYKLPIIGDLADKAKL